MTRFVLDASIALSWFIDHPVAPQASRVKQMLLAGDHAVVPSLWSLEITNGLLFAEKRGHLTYEAAAQALQNLEALLQQRIEVSHEAVSMRRIGLVARQFQLTAYDAAYLDLARETQLALATLDRQLSKAAVKAGLHLIH